MPGKVLRVQPSPVCIASADEEQTAATHRSSENGVHRARTAIREQCIDVS